MTPNILFGLACAALGVGLSVTGVWLLAQERPAPIIDDYPPPGATRTDERTTPGYIAGQVESGSGGTPGYIAGQGIPLAEQPRMITTAYDQHGRPIAIFSDGSTALLGFEAPPGTSQPDRNVGPYEPDPLPPFLISGHDNVLIGWPTTTTGSGNSVTGASALDDNTIIDSPPSKASEKP